jgi:hypothetical protein
MIIVACPTCSGDILILEEEINCAIFRHAMYKDGNFINPHHSKEDMELLIKDNRIWGCGNPFKLIQVDNSYNAILCDWI